MLDNLLTDEPLRIISRGRVRFTYRIDKARVEALGLWEWASWVELLGGRSLRFEVSKNGNVRVTERIGDDDRRLEGYPRIFVEALLHDTALQGTLANAIDMATGSRSW